MTFQPTKAGAFVREALAAAAIEIAHGPDRFTIRGWYDGWKIYDRGEEIVTIHGPQLCLAGRLLWMLREDDPPHAA